MKFRHPAAASPGRRAFTLVELLVVIGIVAVLAAIVVPVIASACQTGYKTRELSAGRQIMVGYAAYAGANDGALLPGYDTTVDQVTLPSGRRISGIMCARYPWRLAPYLSEQIDDIFLINETRRKTAALPVDGFDYQYQASLYPALGLNAYCVGGYDDGSNNFAGDVVRRMGAASHPAQLIVFASARYSARAGDKAVPGFYLVTPPKLWRTKWSTPFDAAKPSSALGNVDLRWSGKAMCAFLDGHTALLDEKELLDMRHWSNTAAENDDPDFTVPR